MAKTSKAQQKATMKYLEKLKTITFRVKPEIAERYKEAADKKNYSMRQFIMEALDEKIEREK